MGILSLHPELTEKARTVNAIKHMYPEDLTRLRDGLAAIRAHVMHS